MAFPAYRMSRATSLPKRSSKLIQLASVLWQVSELNAIIGQHDLDAVGSSGYQRIKEGRAVTVLVLSVSCEPNTTNSKRRGAKRNGSR
jgi:hypothetical protein